MDRNLLVSSVPLPRRSLADAVRSVNEMEEMRPTLKDPAGSSSLTETSRERSLDETVRSVTELLPTLKDDGCVIDALCAACFGNEFTSLDLMHKLIKVGAVSRSKAGLALSAHKRSQTILKHDAQRPASEHSPLAPCRTDGLPALEQSRRLVAV